VQTRARERRSRWTEAHRTRLANYERDWANLQRRHESERIREELHDARATVVSGGAANTSSTHVRVVPC
jgi:hypothetical protein